MTEVRLKLVAVLALCVGLATPAFAVEKRKIQADTAVRQNRGAADTLDSVHRTEPQMTPDTLFNSFLDSNANGIDDSIENQRRKTTKVEPKGAAKKAPEQSLVPAEKYAPGVEKAKSQAKPASAAKSKPRQKPDPKSKK